jgi:hypothetical protein
MQFQSKGLIASVGHWGPFENGRTIPYVELVAADGSGIYRPTLSEGVVAPQLFSTGEADLELSVRDGKLKLRMNGWRQQHAAAPGLAEVAEAA